MSVKATSRTFSILLAFTVGASTAMAGERPLALKLRLGASLPAGPGSGDSWDLGRSFAVEAAREVVFDRLEVLGGVEYTRAPRERVALDGGAPDVGAGGLSFLSGSAGWKLSARKEGPTPYLIAAAGVTRVREWERRVIGPKGRYHSESRAALDITSQAGFGFEVPLRKVTASTELRYLRAAPAAGGAGRWTLSVGVAFRP